MASIEMKTMEVNLDNDAEEDDLENIENIKKIQDAFNCFDRSKSGRISIRVSINFRNTGWGRISEIMLEPISETIYAVDTISQLPKAC